ncbi:MAG: FtsX-like permease family protein [Culicoidibacterales bacterium]
MSKFQFFLWYLKKCFISHFRRWLFPLIIMIAGMVLVNATIGVMLAGNEVIKQNFSENKTLRFMTVDYDTLSRNMTLSQIEAFNQDERFEAFPFFIDSFTAKTAAEDVTLQYVVVPYEALAFFGFETVDQTAWEAGEIMLLDQRIAEQSQLSSGEVIGLPTVKLPLEVVGSEVVAREVAQLPPIPVTIDQTISLEFIPKLSHYSIISPQTYYQVMAQSANKSLAEFKRDVFVENGAAIIVNEFNDIDAVAQLFKNQLYSVDYALEAFENITQTTQIAQIVAIGFSALIGLIIALTITNAIMQFLYYQKHEFGLLQSMGVRKSVLFATAFGEVFLQAVIVLVLVTPIQIMMNSVIVEVFFPYEGVSTLIISSLVFGFNVVFISGISLLGTAVPIWQTLKQPPALLMKAME